MSEVKRFDHVNHAHIDDCEHVESSEGAWVTASDYDALEAEAQALREKVESWYEAFDEAVQLNIASRNKLRSAFRERDDALACAGELAQALRHLMHNIKASGKRLDLGLAKEFAEAALDRLDSMAPVKEVV